MKLLTMCTLILSGSLAHALNPGTYTCSIEPTEKITTDDTVISLEGRPALTMEFSYDGVDLLCMGNLTDDYCDTDYFIVTDPGYDKASKDNVHFSVPGMYADGGFGYTEKGNFIALGDSDGCDGAKLILTKDSGFLKGTIESHYSCSYDYVNGTYKGNVTCSPVTAF